MLLPALLFIWNKTAATDTLKALGFLNVGKISDVIRKAVAAVILQDALVRVDQEHKGCVKHGENQVEGKTNKEEFSDFQPLQMEKTFT